MSEWKTIDTAPRDGTVIDLWHKEGFRIIECWWTGDGFWSCGFGDTEITHWMEMPLMPEF